MQNCVINKLHSLTPKSLSLSQIDIHSQFKFDSDVLSSTDSNDEIASYFFRSSLSLHFVLA